MFLSGSFKALYKGILVNNDIFSLGGWDKSGLELILD